MAAPAGSILPTSYFDGLSQLWGACAYVGSAIAAAGFVFVAASTWREPTSLIKLILRLFMIGLATAFLREWLMRLNDVVNAFGDYMGIDPALVDDKFIRFIAGTSPSTPNTSVWDVIWNTGSVGTAISYALLWLFGWLSWGAQYIVKLVGDILLSAGWALSPLFLSFFMLRPMASVGFRYVLGLAVLVCWPFGWVLAAVVTNAMLDAAATASLMPILTTSSPIAPALTVLLIGAWMIVSSVLAPFVTTKVLLMGANPASAFAQGVAGVGHATIAGTFAGAGAALTGGAAAAGVIASAAVGAMASGAESAARGGGSARTTSTMAGGLSGMYGAAYGRRQTAAAQNVASAFGRMATAAEAMYEGGQEQREFYRDARRRMNRQQRERAAQPHTENPNEAALLIATNARK